VASLMVIAVFFASAQLLALSVVDSLVLIGQKRGPDKNRVVLCSCAGFVLLSADWSSFLICSLEIVFEWTTPAMPDACFPEAFYKCSNILFA